MDYTQQPAESAALELGGTAAEDGNSVEVEDDIRWEMVEGEPELRVELNDSEETLEDGTTLRRQTVTRRRVCPVSDVLIINGVSTEHRRGTDRLLDVSVEEDVLVLPPGVDDPDLSDDLRTMTDVQEIEEALEDGTPVYRRITTTTIVPAPHDLPPDHSSGVGLEQTDAQPIAELDTGRDDLTETVKTLESTGGFSEPSADTTPDHGVSSLPDSEVSIEKRADHGVSSLPDSEVSIEKRAEQVVAQSVQAALQEVLRSTSPGRCLDRVNSYTALSHLVSYCYVFTVLFHYSAVLDDVKLVH